jgi:hypothetical protein
MGRDVDNDRGASLSRPEASCDPSIGPDVAHGNAHAAPGVVHLDRHYPRQENPTQWVKASFPVVNADKLPETMTEEDLTPTMQTTAFSVGNLFAFAMSCHFPEIPRGWDWRTAPAARDLLKPIWPTSSTAVNWPPSSMSDDDARSFSAAVVRYYEDFAQ